MATAVGLNMKITADTAGIGRGMSRTERLLQGVDRNAQSAARSLRAIATVQIGGAVLKGLNSIAGTLTSVANSAVSYANSLRSSIDETAKLAQRTGIAVEALQGFRLAAELSGVQNFEEAISKLSIKIAQAGQGNKDVQQTFQRLNLSFEELQRLSPEKRFTAVAAAIQGLPNEMERAAAAVKLFEEGGVQLLPLFAQNLGEIQARAERLGIVLGRDQTAAIERMNDSLLLVRKTLDGILGQVLANIADVVTAISEEFLGFVEAFEGLNGAQGGNAIADVITQAVLSGVEGFLQIIQTIGDALLSFGESVGNSIRFIRTLTGGAQIERRQLEGRLVAAEDRRRNAAFGSDEERLADREVQRITAQLRQLTEGFDATDLRESFASSIDRALLAAGNVRTRLADRPPRAAAAEAAVAAPNLLRAGLAAANDFVRQKSVLVKPFAELGKGLVGQFIDNANRQAERLKPILEGISQLEKQRAEKAAEIEEDRLDALSRRSNQALSVGDIRSGGISEILRIATGREDPAIGEYRKQLGELQKMNANIAALQAEKVKIIGGAGRAA